MYPLCASLSGRPGIASHSFSCTPVLSQKLSNPAPTNRLDASGITAAQMSVRPVRVGFRPNASAALAPPPSNMTRPALNARDKTSRCTTATCRLIKLRFVASISPVPIMKQTLEVTEFAVIKSEIPRASSVPCASRHLPRWRGVSSDRRSPRTRQTVPSKTTSIITPSDVLVHMKFREKIGCAPVHGS